MRIDFNPDNLQVGGGDIPLTKDAYMTLINALTSRLPTDKIDYPAVSNAILQFSKQEVLNQIPPEYDSVTKEDIKRRVEQYFSDKTMNADTNYIGKINLVLLQCIILFTDYAMKLTGAKLYGLPAGIKDTYTILTDKEHYNKYIKLNGKPAPPIIWEDYNLLRKIITGEGLLYVALNMLYPTSLTDEKLFIICVIDFISISDIIESYLNNVFYCGFSSKFITADGFLLSPFEFMVHDIVHAENFKYLQGRGGISLDNLRNFYYYCKKTISNKIELYKIKLYIFLQIHEGPLIITYPFTKTEKEIDFLLSGSLDKDRKIKRYLNPTDLGLAFPKSIQDNEAEIVKYITDAHTLYINKFKEWGTSGSPATNSNYLSEINTKVSETLKVIPKAVAEDTDTYISVGEVAATGGAGTGGGGAMMMPTSPSSLRFIPGKVYTVTNTKMPLYNFTGKFKSSLDHNKLMFENVTFPKLSGGLKKNVWSINSSLPTIKITEQEGGRRRIRKTRHRHRHRKVRQTRRRN